MVVRRPSPVPAPLDVDDDVEGELQSGTMPIGRSVEMPKEARLPRPSPPPVRPISRPHLRAALVRQSLRRTLSGAPPKLEAFEALSSSSMKAAPPVTVSPSTPPESDE